MLSWFNGGDADVLEPKGWFHKAHKTGNWIWAPPPAAAEVAVEQLCESRHARPWNAHLFVCPALMTSYWRKMLSKVADCMLTIQPGFSHWPVNMHEPLVVAIICPIASTSPWVQRGTPRLVELKADLSEMWSSNPEGCGDRLREYWPPTKELG
jgi:hypothetical protein